MVAYTVATVGVQGHFTALLPVEGETRRVPLCDEEGKLLPLPYAEDALRTDPLQYLSRFVDLQMMELDGHRYPFARISEEELRIVSESRILRQRLLRYVVKAVGEGGGPTSLR